MGDNDRVSREAVRSLAYQLIALSLDDSCDVDRMVDALSAVPHEMSAREYLETEARMCNFYGLPNTFNLSGHTIDDAIKMVENFAREHPERSEDNGNSQLDR